jgi:SLT domain-containing protein
MSAEAAPPEANLTNPDTTLDGRARRTRAEHFHEEAEKRVNRILLEIDRLERLSNTSSNEYSVEQVETMFAAIFERTQRVAKKFDHSQGPAFEMPELNPF